ncbi:MAG: hypothetical protein JOZ12_06215 [Sinobacteraceae bacterium]|nr:hypothetical protein [Nevskiaceae bacterium]
MTVDARGWRIALVADMLVNPAPASRSSVLDVFATLERVGYGLLQLPPSGEHGLLLPVIADQAAEYAHHGYALVAVGVHGQPDHGLHWRRLARLLRERSVTLPPRHMLRPDAEPDSEHARLASFLTSYDLPAAEQRRWRV